MRSRFAQLLPPLGRLGRVRALAPLNVGLVRVRVRVGVRVRVRVGVRVRVRAGVRVRVRSRARRLRARAPRRLAGARPSGPCARGSQAPRRARGIRGWHLVRFRDGFGPGLGLG